MNLALKIPQNILDKYDFTTYTYAVNFDVFENRYVNGFLIVSLDYLYVFIDDELIKKVYVKDYDTIKVSSTHKGGYLYGKIGEKEYVFAEFSKHCHEKIASMALGIDLYLQDGFYAVNEMNETHCPKCGTPYLDGSKFCTYCGKSKGLLKTFVPYIFKYKWLILLQLAIILIVVLLETSQPQIYQRLVDDYLKAGVFNNGFIIMMLLLVIIFLLKTFFNVIKGMINPRISFGLINDLRIKIYDKVQHLSLSSANKRTTGGLITRISDDVSEISNILTSSFNYIFYSAIELIVLIVVMFIENYKLALLVIIPAPIIVYGCEKMWELIGKQYYKRWKHLSNSNNILHDILSGIKVVKTYGTEEKEVKRFKDSSIKLRDVDIHTEQFWSTFTPIIWFLPALIQIIIYYIIGSSIINPNGTFTIGDLVKWSSFSGMLFSCVNMLSSFPRRISEFKISAEKINDILSEESSEEVGESVNENISGLVEFDKVRFGYISFTPVLKEISFKINPGETIGIVGYSGSGKTTLVNLLMKLYEPNHGRILVDGQDISKLDSFQYRKKLGVVLQETLLFSGTILENIMYGNENATFDDVIKVCKMAKAHDFIMKKEFGYDSKLGKQGEGLSGGEKQRIAIARALLSNPSIFIFDEATSSLDTITEKEIQESIAEISKNKTTFIIAHRLSTLKNANRLIVLNNGKMVEFGSHKELIDKKGYYYGLVEAQYMNYEKRKD